jgi:hypothetical protein
MAAPRALSSDHPSIPIERVDVRVCRLATDGGAIAFDAARPGLGLVLRGGEAARHTG